MLNRLFRRDAAGSELDLLAILYLVILAGSERSFSGGGGRYVGLPPFFLVRLGFVQVSVLVLVHQVSNHLAVSSQYLWRVANVARVCALFVAAWFSAVWVGFFIADFCWGRERVG